MRENAAFTLPEVLIAVMILAIALVGMMRLFIYCSALAKTSKGITLALAEAQNKLEEVRNHPYALISADYASGGTPGDTFTLSQVSGTGAIAIDNSNPLLLDIDIVVTWQDDNGRTLTSTLSTFLAKR
jgi:prepilin-type N-terminal cleavage/methylation domain-containing protein